MLGDEGERLLRRLQCGALILIACGLAAHLGEVWGQ